MSTTGGAGSASVGSGSGIGAGAGSNQPSSISGNIPGTKGGMAPQNVNMPTFNPNKQDSQPNQPIKSDKPVHKPNVYDEFKPEKKDDNMMAENDPVYREPAHWQKEAKKDPY